MVVNGQTVAQALHTTGSPSKIALLADRTRLRANRNDLCYVMVELQDAAGKPVADGVQEIFFTAKGEGELAAVGNANPHEMASFRQPHRRAFHGRCLAILRPTGKRGTITLEARGEGLRSAAVTIEVG